MNITITKRIFLMILLSGSMSIAKSFRYSEELSEANYQENRTTLTENLFVPPPLCPIEVQDELPICKRRKPVIPPDPCSDLRVGVEQYYRICLATNIPIPITPNGIN